MNLKSEVISCSGVTVLGNKNVELIFVDGNIVAKSLKESSQLFNIPIIAITSVENMNMTDYIKIHHGNKSYLLKFNTQADKKRIDIPGLSFLNPDEQIGATKNDWLSLFEQNQIPIALPSSKDRIKAISFIIGLVVVGFVAQMIWLR